MHDELRQLRHQVGEPSLASLEKHAGLTGHRVSKATFGNLLHGRGKPRWETVEAFVAACVGYARSRRPPQQLPPNAADLDGWRIRYDVAYPSTVTTVDAAFTAVRQDYLARLRERYQRVDLEVLTPLTEQDEYPPVGLREVYIAQAVRADPPPVELPRELLRRLVDAGELDRDELPDGVAPEVLEKIRQAYRKRPARSVVQVLTESDQQRLVLLGDPGAGKSTLARYLALTLAEASVEGPLYALAGWLPLLVELRTYADVRWRDRTFLDLIDHLHATEGLGLPQPVADSFLRHDGRAVVIFDGLDELFDPHLREMVTHQITGFAARYPRARIVVTSRVIGYRRAILDAAGFAHHMLQDLEPSQITAFVTRWYEIACPHNPTEATRLRERLLAAVDGSAAVRELAGNPLLLTILSIIGRRRELPRDRRAVYQHAVSVLVEHWDPSKHLRDTRVDQGMPYLDYDDKLELLRLVARRMQDGPAGLAGNHIPGPELLAEFDTYLRQRYELPPDRAKPAAKAMLDQFRERNFILSRFGAEVYGFVHRAFLEYLAAADIAQRFAERELSEDELITEVFGRHWSDPAWQEVLLLITGMIKERFTGRVIDHLLQADPQWVLRPFELPRHALLAVRCIGEVRKLGVLSTQSLAIIDTVIDLLEIAKEREERYDSSLTHAVEQTVLPVLTTFGPHWAGRDRYENWYLQHGQFLYTSAVVSQPVISLAARIGAVLLTDSAEFRELLHAQATHSTDKDIRRAAVRALVSGWSEDPDTGPLLRERATTDQHWGVRRIAMEALIAGWRDDPDTLPWLRERVATDPDKDVRRVAIEDLVNGWREDPDTGPLLRERATTDPDEGVRRVAVRVLVAGWREDPDTLSWLRERATTDSDGTIRRLAVQALASGWREDPNTLALLRERATTDPDWTIRQVAVQALASGWREDPNTLALLRECATTDQHGAVRRVAVRALAGGWREDPGTLSWLRERATTDSDGTIRQVAVQALASGWREDPDTPPLLRKCATTDQHWAVRRAAVQALASGWREDPDTPPLLRKCATTDQHWAVRRAAVQALA
ncbi:MAG: HEAT repeat domain-containing protein [Pseudonocardiaceae bacterium]